MSVKSLFQVNAVIALLYGIGLLIVPSPFLGMYDIGVTTGTALVAQLFGVSLIAVGLITWFARDSAPNDARQAIMQGLFWTDVLGTVVAVLGIVSGAVNALGWSTVAVYALLATAYGYLIYVAPEPAASPTS